MDHLLPRGVYPASVTPFDQSGKVDGASLARLLAYFEAAGCKGVVLAGTNGEGPSLSAYEKRDLVRLAQGWRGTLKLILGVATPSLDEAHWLCQQAGKNGADAVLVMPPAYFRTASEKGIEAWFVSVIEASPVPVLVYNFPKMTGFTLSPELLGRLSTNQNMIGAKDSSGDESNLSAYRASLAADKRLFVGDENLLLKALRAEWSGSISGAANVAPVWLSRVVEEWFSDPSERAEVSFQVVRPVVEAVRRSPQPATNKAVLHALGIIDRADLRLPLEAADPAAVLECLREHLGVQPGEVGLSARP